MARKNIPKPARPAKETFDILRKQKRPLAPLGPVELSRLTAWDKEAGRNTSGRALADSAEPYRGKADAVRTKVFKSGNSKAVRLPTEIASDLDLDTEVELSRSGDMIVIRPVDAGAGLREAVALLRAMPKPATIELLDRTQSRDTLDD